jgi:hypothetical protein
MIKKYLYAQDEHNRITDIHEENEETVLQYAPYLKGEFDSSLVSKLNLGYDSIINGKIVHIGITKQEEKSIIENEKNARIQDLKQLLTETDWKVVVNAERIQAGLPLKYPDLHSQRQVWRDEINQLEKGE